MKSFKRLNFFLYFNMALAMAKTRTNGFVSISLKCLHKIHQSLRIVDCFGFHCFDLKVEIRKWSISNVSNLCSWQGVLKRKQVNMCNAQINLTFFLYEIEEKYTPMLRYHAARNVRLGEIIKINIHTQKLCSESTRKIPFSTFVFLLSFSFSNGSPEWE